VKKRTGNYKGKKKGATSFVLVTPKELYDKLNKNCRDAVIPISRKFAEMLNLETLPMNADYKTRTVVDNQLDVAQKATETKAKSKDSLPKVNDLTW
jgi:hypothetical protein|tara:strand:+ start:2988 stop:3275 length:288 start_codon:yes stop_codon:yes gene_type:complete